MPGNRVTQRVQRQENLQEFSLLGGPLHRMGCRLGLVRGGTDTIALGLALGWLLWVVLVALAWIEGSSANIFSLSVIGGHVRLLVAIPLLFMWESWIDPRMTAFVRIIVHSKVVRKTALPALESDIARITRWKDSWWLEAISLLAAILMSFAPQLQLLGTTASYDASQAAGELTVTGLWYWIVCLTLFRFLMLRWFSRLVLWWYFLWRVARLELNLVPTHPDGVAGLGYLEIVHAEFSTIIFGISAIQSAAFAESMVAGKMALTALYPTLAVLLMVDAVMFIGPLFFFVPKLWLCRATGLETYMDLAARYVNDFDRKWLAGGAGASAPLLGTPDLQSLADLSNSVSIVRDMQLAPVSRRLLLGLAMPALLPLLPLLLFQYPVAELADKLFKMLLGM